MLSVLGTLLARTSERSLFSSDPGATGKFSGIPLEIQWFLLETSENLLETS